MKKFAKTVLLNLTLMLLFFSATGQETFFGLEVSKQLKTTEAKDLQRPGSCWVNAGVALLEAEWLRNSNTEVDVSELNFVRNAYSLKTKVYVETKGNIRIDETGIAYDVPYIMREYGMAPDDAFIAAEEMGGEMDAIIRGAMHMVMNRENGVFTERWQNTVEEALSQYIGYARQSFKFRDTDHSAGSFAEASEINSSDFVMITADGSADINAAIEIGLKNNWRGNKAYNLQAGQLYQTLYSAANSGYTALLYIDLNKEMIYEDEQVAFVPAMKISQLTTFKEGEEISYEPLPEREVTVEERQAAFEKNLDKTLDYLLVYGISKDKDGKEYLLAKKVCSSGNQAIHLSPAFVKLNLMYLMVNKEGLPKEMKSKLKL
jgi:bleomycin hydrolase